ncbi:MAG: hypothetical protein Q8R36_02085 [bacterium]|nr:hypothetical protein [bacterium]
MHLAFLIDAIVKKSNRLHPALRAIIRPLLYPFVIWRAKGIAYTLATQYKWLPTTSWKDVEKHGQNVIYCTCDKTNIFTKEKKVVGVWVVDYKNRTVRTVLDVPEQYQKQMRSFEVLRFSQHLFFLNINASRAL